MEQKKISEKVIQEISNIYGTTNLTDLNLNQRLFVVQTLAEVAVKDAYNKHFDFNYTSSTSAIKTVKPLLNACGVRLRVNKVEDVINPIPGEKKFSVHIHSKYEFTFINAHDKEDYETNYWYAQDKGDATTTGKVDTYAEKFFLLKYFHIETSEFDPENDGSKPDSDLPPESVQPQQFYQQSENKNWAGTAPYQANFPPAQQNYGHQNQMNYQQTYQPNNYNQQTQQNYGAWQSQNVNLPQQQPQQQPQSQNQVSSQGEMVYGVQKAPNVPMNQMNNEGYFTMNNANNINQQPKVNSPLTVPSNNPGSTAPFPVNNEQPQQPQQPVQQKSYTPKQTELDKILTELSNSYAPASLRKAIAENSDVKLTTIANMSDQDIDVIIKTFTDLGMI